AELSAQGYEVIGLEPSAQMQAQAGLRLQGNGVNVARCQGVAQRMPFADSSFDSVVSTFPAPYVLDEVTIAEIVRVLKPGGVWVTVGLWVVVDGNWLSKMLPVFYGRPNPEVINLLHARLASAGLRTKIEDRRVGRALVG